MNTIKKILIAAFVVAAFSGCEKMLDLTNPNQASDNTFWKTQADFQEAIVSCYTPLKNWNGGYFGTRGIMVSICRGDDIEFRNDIQPIFSMSMFTNDANNGVSSNMFEQLYRIVYRTNTILDKIAGKDFSETFANKIKGEAYFLRGLAFYALATEYGEVPLRLKGSQDPKDFQKEKSKQADVYAQAVKDMEEAGRLLPVKNEKGKPTKGAAYAFMGKIYLYTKEWQKAKDVLEPLTKAPYSYSLVDDYSWNFDVAHEYNSESIFEIIYDAAGGSNQWDDGEQANSAQSTTIAVEYAAASVGGWYEANPTQKIMDIMMKEKRANNEHDKRLITSVAWDYPGCTYYSKPIQNVLSSSELKQYWLLKYQNSATATSENGIPPSYINHRAMRYAEVLTMLAECELELGQEGKAIEYLNAIRMRGGNLPAYSGETGKASVKEELIRQCAIEFFKEGHRFYDLRRWGLLKDALKAQNTIRFNNFQDRNYYLPIPSKELQNNLLCEQAPGW